MARGSERFFVIVRAPNGDVREFPVTETGAVLGRDESADIRVDDKKVSRRHACFRVVDGELWVEDLGSSNGVRLNGKKIDRRARFLADDQIRVAGYVISPRDIQPATGSAARESPVSLRSKEPGLGEDAPRMHALDDPVRGMTFPLRPGENIVGRLEECDIPILDGSVSRQHARLVCSEVKVTVTDLGSSNGTFLNDERIETADLLDQDLLRFGNIGFRVELPPGMRSFRPRRPKKTAPRRRRRSRAIVGMTALFFAVALTSATLYWRLVGSSEESFLESVAGWVSRTLASYGPIERSSDGGALSDAGTETDAQPVDVRPPADAGRLADAGRPADAGESIGGGGSSVITLRTSTSPFSRRDPDGLPLDLPEVEVSFDFDDFVRTKLDVAKGCAASGDFACVREAIQALLERDPINREAKEMLKAASEHEMAERRLKEAEAFLASKDHYEAYQAYMSIPESVPASARARASASKIKADAVENALMKAQKLERRDSSWSKAHELFVFALVNDPSSDEAMVGLRALEKRMRESNMEFTGVELTPTGETRLTKPDQVKQRIRERYEGDAALAEAAHRYALGDLKSALELADTAERKARGIRRRAAREQKAALATAQEKYVRTRTEISNNPEAAWGMIIDLMRTESEILPSGVKSFLVKELELSTAEAFANAGESLFDLGKHEQAFQRWQAGYKLDRSNPRVLAGLRKLERYATRLADEAELATQRGSVGACEDWRRITRITAAESQVHQRARRRGEQVCQP